MSTNSRQSRIEDDVNLILLIFGRYILPVAIFISFIITIVSPSLRVAVYGILETGFFTFIALLITYAGVRYWRERKQ